MYEALKKVLVPQDTKHLLSYEEVMALKNVVVSDPNEEIFIKAKTQYGIMCLYPFIDKIVLHKDIPDIEDYTCKCNNFSCINDFLNIADVIRIERKETGAKTLELKVKKKSPIRIETDNFIIMIVRKGYEWCL